MHAKAYHVGDLRNLLLKTALDMLAEDGAELLSLRAVARRAGVSAMAPYRHYADKSALLAAIAAQGYVDLRHALERAEREASRDKLAAQGMAYVRFALDHPALFRLMAGPRLVGDHESLSVAGKACYDVLRTRLQGRGLSGPALEERTLGSWCLMHGVAALMLDGKLADKYPGASEDVARRVMKAMLSVKEPT